MNSQRGIAIRAAAANLSQLATLLEDDIAAMQASLVSPPGILAAITHHACIVPVSWDSDIRALSTTCTATIAEANIFLKIVTTAGNHLMDIATNAKITLDEVSLEI